MINYLKGTITDISKNFIILENSGIGYIIYTANFFVLNENAKIYIYHHKTEITEEYYGFKTKEQLDLFKQLIKLKGIGCKIAINLTGVDPTQIYNADINTLQNYSKIGYKTAELIMKSIKCENTNNDLIEVLATIGYKKTDIINVIPKLKSKDVDLQIKESILLLERN